MDGQIVELTIEDMSVEGQGIGRMPDGMVVFVEGAVKGDRVRARLVKVRKSFAFAKATETLEGSPLRSAEFDCPSYKHGCGGCPMGSLEYEAQLEIKEKQVRDRLERIAGIRPCSADEAEDANNTGAASEVTAVINPIAGMKDEDNDGQGHWRYRNKATFPVSTGGIITRKGGIVENLGEPAVGFYEAKSHRVVDCGDCYIQSIAAMAAADALRRFMQEDKITGYDPRWKKGLMKQLIVKTAFGTGEVMVILAINGKGIPGVAKLIKMLDESIAEVGYSLESVVLNIDRAGVSSGEKQGDKYETVAGKATIIDQLGDLKFEISPASFYQVNPAQMKRLYDVVRKYCGRSANAVQAERETQTGIGSRPWACDPSDKPVILDLYCGIGSIGLYCADLAEMVIGVESVEEAVRDANRNSVINGIVNSRYICGRAEEVLPAAVRAADEGEGSADKAAFSSQRATAGGNRLRAEAPGIDESLREYIRRADIAILDPPRAGCRKELLDAVAFAEIPHIIYVSCDPATLARDIRLLEERGYSFIEATPVDMFPNTMHVECCSLLVKTGDSEV